MMGNVEIQRMILTGSPANMTVQKAGRAEYRKMAEDRIRVFRVALKR